MTSDVRRSPRRREAGALMALLLVATACTSGPSAAEPGAEGSNAASSRAPLAASLTFALESDASGQATATLANGGTVSASAADGTTFELVVPPAAVAGDTEITMTPLTGVRGIGDGAVHAVQLEPDGLVFFELTRLTITPSTPIPVADQLMFEATGDGSDPGPALVDPSSEPIVLLLEHFSIGGVASVTPQQRATFIEKSASNAESRINRQIAELAQQERARQLSSDEPDTEADRVRLYEDVARLLDEYEREVLERRRQAAPLTCAASTRFIQTLLSLERARQLWGLADDPARYGAVTDEATSAFLKSIPPCEEEAIQQCREVEDPKLLVRYWLGVRRTAELLSVPDVPVPELGDMPDRATEICEPRGHQFEFSGEGTGDWQGVTVPVTWHLWGLRCEDDPAGEWRVWEEHAIEGAGSERVGPPSDDPQGSMRVTFAEDGTIAKATLITPAGDYLAVRPTLTLGGTDLTLAPPDRPTEVHAVINAGTVTIPVTAPVVPADGTIAGCDDPAGTED